MRKHDKRHYRRGEKTPFSLPLITPQSFFSCLRRDLCRGLLTGNGVGVNNPFHKISFWLATATDLHFMKNNSKFRPNLVSLKNI